MRVALFGGTFNPIHWGHLLIAEAARDSSHLDRVLFLPTSIPPHKPEPLASPGARLAMMRLAIRSNPSFEINDWEIRQNRMVYTVETLAHFKQTHPRDTLFFIVGSDMFQSIDTWRQGRALLSQCHFLVVERPECRWSTIPLSLRRRATRVECPLVSISSHGIRERVQQKRSIRYQVPATVERYIRQHRLYRA